MIVVQDRDSFSLKLEDTENWLYEDGEDQQKQVYIDKLAELKVSGNKVCDRPIISQDSDLCLRLKSSIVISQHKFMS